MTRAGTEAAAERDPRPPVSVTVPGDAATDAAFTALVGSLAAVDEGRDVLRRLAADCERDIAAETALQLGIPVPECAREGWTP